MGTANTHTHSLTYTDTRLHIHPPPTHPHPTPTHPPTPKIWGKWAVFLIEKLDLWIRFACWPFSTVTSFPCFLALAASHRDTWIGFGTFPTPCFAWALPACILEVLIPLLDPSKSLPVPVCIPLCLSRIHVAGYGDIRQHWRMLWPAISVHYEILLPGYTMRFCYQRILWDSVVCLTLKPHPDWSLATEPSAYTMKFCLLLSWMKYALKCYGFYPATVVNVPFWVLVCVIIRYSPRSILLES